ncbi:MAG: ABC transporter permease, partial [Chloroflexi bacterium HGW-Chloroflexi-1]
VIGIFVVEGMVIGALSWLFAALLSYPVGKLLVDAFGSALQMPMGSYRYSFGGVVGWLAIVLALSALSSLWPARQATRVSVREALAYE